MPSDTLNDLMEVRTMFSNIGKNLQKRFEEGRQKGMEKGLEQGLEQGLELGIQQGALNMALNLLVAKFGANEERWRERLEDFDEAELNTFVLRLIDASSEEELDQ